MTSRAPRFRRGGFTLLEVLVSLAIFALAAVMLGATYANVLLNYGAASRRLGGDQDLRLVRAAVLGEPDRKVVEQGGDLPLPDERSAHWEARIEETELADLFRVTLHCSVREPGQAQPVVRDESFMLLRPTWSDPVERDKLRKAASERLAKRFGS